MGLWRWRRHAKQQHKEDVETMLADEPLSYEEEVTLQSADQVQQTSQSYHPATRNSYVAIPSATGSFSIESLLSLNPPVIGGSPSGSPGGSPRSTSAKSSGGSLRGSIRGSPNGLGNLNTVNGSSSSLPKVNSMSSSSLSSGSSNMKKKLGRFSMVLPRHKSNPDSSFDIVNDKKKGEVGSKLGSNVGSDVNLAVPFEERIERDRIEKEWKNKQGEGLGVWNVESEKKEGGDGGVDENENENAPYSSGISLTGSSDPTITEIKNNNVNGVAITDSNVVDMKEGEGEGEDKGEGNEGLKKEKENKNVKLQDKQELQESKAQLPIQSELGETHEQKEDKEVYLENNKDVIQENYSNELSESQNLRYNFTNQPTHPSNTHEATNTTLSLSQSPRSSSTPPLLPPSSVPFYLPPITTTSTNHNHPTNSQRHRDNSLSPLYEPTQTFSDSPRLSSRASSLIFERSVQDFSINDDKIPSHYHNEDYIPPVLEASTNAITDSSLEPNMIEVVSLSPGSLTAARTRSISSSYQPHHFDENSPSSPTRQSNYHFNNNVSGVTTPHNNNTTTNNGGLGVRLSSSATLPGNPKPPHRSSSPNLADRHILSFCSFADIVSSENMPHVNTVPSSPSPSSPRSKQFINGFITTPIPNSPPAELLSSPEEYVIAPEEFELEDDPGLTIRSMGETLRYNTGEITSQLA